MFTLLATLVPCTMMLLALVCTYIATLYTGRACEQGDAPHYSDAEAWAVDLEWDLMAVPEAACPVMARAVSMGLVPDPWAMPTKLATMLGALVATPTLRVTPRAHTAREGALGFALAYG